MYSTRSSSTSCPEDSSAEIQSNPNQTVIEISEDSSSSNDDFLADVSMHDDPHDYDKTALRMEYFTSYTVSNHNPRERDIQRFLLDSKCSLVKILTNEGLRRSPFLLNINIYVSFCQIERLIVPVRSEFMTVKCASDSDIEDAIDVLTELLALKAKESNKSVTRILHMEVNVKSIPLRHGAFIPLPKVIAKTKSVENVHCDDNYSFKHAVLMWATYFLKKRLSYRDSVDICSEKITCGDIDFDFTGLTFPVEVRDVGIFEDHNPHLSINVFGVERFDSNLKIIGPLYRTRKETKRHINLLFMEDLNENSVHYAYIKTTSILVRFLTTKRVRTYVCNTCLKHFTVKRKYNEHNKRKERKGCRKMRSLF